MALLAEAAPSAGRDARDEHTVAFREGRDRRARVDDGADCFVAEDGARLHLRDVALEDVQVRSADRRRVDADNRVGRLEDARIGLRLPGLLAGTAVDERLHCESSFRLHSVSAGALATHIGAHAEACCGFSVDRLPALGASGSHRGGDSDSGVHDDATVRPCDDGIEVELRELRADRPRVGRSEARGHSRLRRPPQAHL